MTRIFHEIAVAERRYLSPGMVRLTFTGEGLEHFNSTGIADEYLRLFFADEETGEVVLPIIDAEGRWTYRKDRPPVRCSTYTVRRFDKESRELDIDFVVHGGGMASDWAMSVPIGGRITINSPRGLYAPPSDTPWQLLMADATGLTALSRILEQTPAHIRSQVVVEVADRDHEFALPDHPAAKVEWLHGSGNGVGPSRLDVVFDEISFPKEPIYLWVAAEQTPARAIRKRARANLKLKHDRYKIVAYWIEALQDWTRRYEALPEDVRTQIDEVLAKSTDQEAARDFIETMLDEYDL